jgi:isopropylmalate/homocitrate/citramalate synthase
MTPPEIHVHVHVDGGGAENLSVHVYLPTDTTELEGLLMATKEELLASIADVKTALVELQSDVARVIADLEAALEAQDLTAVAAAVEDLKATVTTIDEAVETASPEPTEPEPTP